jgi:hypothetical protein
MDNFKNTDNKPDTMADILASLKILRESQSETDEIILIIRYFSNAKHKKNEQKTIV